MWTTAACEEIDVNCPYCSHSMESYKLVLYLTSAGIRLAHWVRCTACEHKTLAAVESLGANYRDKLQAVA